MLEKLRTLYLDRNRLRELPDSISKLQKLHSLDLTDNKLTKLPKSIQFLSQLRHLRIQKNLIVEIPQEFKNLILSTCLFDKDLQWPGKPKVETNNKNQRKSTNCY